MSLTAALAVWGALLSTLLAVAKGIEFWRDRPKLEVGVSASINLDVPHPRVGITVTNRGRQPVTIMKAGFVVQAEHHAMVEKSGVSLPVTRTLPFDDGHELRLVAPGGATRYELLFTELPPMLHVDWPLRAYVVDSNDRVAWGAAAPLFRRFVGSWKPLRPLDPELLASVDEPIQLMPVYPWWKLWKPKALRGRPFRRDELLRLP